MRTDVFGAQIFFHIAFTLLFCFISLSSMLTLKITLVGRRSHNYLSWGRINCFDYSYVKWVCKYECQARTCFSVSLIHNLFIPFRNILIARRLSILSCDIGRATCHQCTSYDQSRKSQHQWLSSSMIVSGGTLVAGGAKMSQLNWSRSIGKLNCINHRWH